MVLCSPDGRIFIVLFRKDLFTKETVKRFKDAAEAISDIFTQGPQPFGTVMVGM